LRCDFAIDLLVLYGIGAAADALKNTFTAFETPNSRYGLSPDIETYTMTAAVNQEEIYV
jgi:hypothetical protein